MLNLFADLQDESGLTYVFIAHDLGVVWHVSDRIAVMYLGEIVEVGDVDPLHDAPAHPYTEHLLEVASGWQAACHFPLVAGPSCAPGVTPGRGTPGVPRAGV